MLYNINWKFLSFTLIVILLFSGCPKKGVQRKDVWGMVTWNGQPIPTGSIGFEPDFSKGNQGPSGFAGIKDGKYDTRSVATFKGCIPGASKVFITAGDGKNVSESRPYGTLLFPIYATEVEIPKGGGEINLVVPN